MPGLLPELAHGQDPSGRPDHLREREQPRPGRDGGADRIRLGRDDDDPRAGRRERAEQAEVLVGRRHDLVVRAEPEPAEDDVAAVGRARRQRDLERLGADEVPRCAPHLLPQLHHACEVRPAAAAVAIVPLELPR